MASRVPRGRPLTLTGAAAVVIAVVAAPAGLAGCSQPPPTFPRAPVVLVSIDTLRADRLPAYGYAAGATPHLDRFRKDALLFTNAWSPSPMTLPAHVSMLTALLPPEHGVRNNVGYTFDAGAHRHLPGLLAARGYATGAAVSSYVLRAETGLGGLFSFYEDSLEARPGAAFGESQRPGDVTARHARRFVEERRAGEPFFLFLHLYEPHVPYDPPPAFRGRFAHPYDGEIAAADAIVGAFFDFLRARGLYERSIVIVTSDHGEGLGDHGEDQHSILLYAEATRVPLFLKLPGSAGGGRSVDAPAHLVDLLPTVLDLVGVADPPGGGRSLRRLEAEGGPRFLYAETLYPRIQLGWSELKSVTDGRWHYIHSPRPELYDLRNDPAERHDVVAREPARAAALEQALDRFPEGKRALGAVDPATAERLASLGYVGTARERGPAAALPNPVDSLPQLNRLREGFSLASASRYREAAGVLEAVVRDAPGMVEAWIRLGEVRVALGQPEEAVAAFDRALARSGVELVDIVLARGHARLAARDLAGAERDARRARPVLAARAQELLARVASARGAADEAVGHAREAARLRPVPGAFVLLGEIQIKAGRLDPARESLEEAERRAREAQVPRVAGLEALRADLLARSGRFAEAEAAYRREIDGFADNLLAHANLAALLFAQGRGRDAAGVLEALLRANPHPAAYRAAAAAREAFGDRAGAARFRRRAAEAARVPRAEP